MKKTIISVDLALKAIQVCKYSNNTVHSNIEMTPSQFASFLANLSPSSIIFEAWGGGQLLVSVSYTQGSLSSCIGKIVLWEKRGLVIVRDYNQSRFVRQAPSL